MQKFPDSHKKENQIKTKKSQWNITEQMKEDSRNLVICHIINFVFLFDVFIINKLDHRKDKLEIKIGYTFY